MKKMLVLMLVLGMASIANATILTWTADSITITSIGGTSVVQLVADNADIYAYAKWVGANPAGIATITNIVARAAAGPDADVKNPSQTADPGWWTVQSLDFTPPSSVAAGAQYDVTVKGLALGTFAVGSDALGTNDMLNITVIPEPMTVALLGLGGLFLLRRRK